MSSYTLSSFYRKVRNTIQFHYYKRKNSWKFPSNMAHTSGARMAEGTYEPELTRLLTENIHEGATVIDVGANVGYFARLFAKTVKETGRVIAFEVEEQNYLSLCYNTAEFRNVTPVALAASDRNSLSEIHLSSHSSCHSLLRTENHQFPTSFNLISMKLDTFWDLFLDRSKVECIKIDVEGAEIMVLKGMREMLAHNAVNMMIVEFCPQVIINVGFDPIELYNRLSPAFHIKIAEEDYKISIGNEDISSAEQFNMLKDYLLDRGEFINCNLFCKLK